MIAVEVFVVLVVVGLITVVVMQKMGGSSPQAKKGDAVKTPEEIASHRRKP